MPEIISAHETHTLSSLSAIPAEEKTILFGKYELGRLLGRGGFAKVYHGRDLRTGKSVAIKSINKANIIKGNFTSNIKREVSIMTRLRHSHIIRLFEVLATKSRVYFIMEFAKGGELFAKVSKGRFSEDLSRRYFYQIVSAVGYCHSRGVYHRDLKLENLLLDEHWNLKITDFGLSAVKDPTRPGILHTLCGTPAYVAPEILSKRGYDGAKVDIWSCGIILFVMTAGFLPFNDGNLMNLYRKIYRGEYKCPKFMSTELKDLLACLLDTNPDTRISIQGIIDHPWFKKGEVKLKLLPFFITEDENEVKNDEFDQEGQNGDSRFLNAFDLISFSPGFNLNGLFLKEKENCWETFLSKEGAEVVVERIEKVVCEVSGVEVDRLKGGMGVKVEGQNGEFGLVVEVKRLNEDFVVVRVRKREKDVGPSHGFWKDKIRPMINDIVYKSGQDGLDGSGAGPSSRSCGV